MKSLIEIGMSRENGHLLGTGTNCNTGSTGGKHVTIEEPAQLTREGTDQGLLDSRRKVNTSGQLHVFAILVILKNL